MKQITVGRSSSNQVVIDGRYTTVSGNHCTITEQNGNIFLADHSTNGTYINGQKYHNQQTIIRQGDRIRLSTEYDLPWSVIESSLLQGGTQLVEQSSRHTNRYDAGRVGMQNNQQQNVQVQVQVPQQPQPIMPEKTEPKCLHKWSWGAFWLGWIWAIGNSVWWGLLCLIPYVNIVVLIILGINGNQSAWEKFTGTADEFDRKQESWNKAGWIYFFVCVVLGVIIGIASAAM